MNSLRISVSQYLIAPWYWALIFRIVNLGLHSASESEDNGPEDEEEEEAERHTSDDGDHNSDSPSRPSEPGEAGFLPNIGHTNSREKPDQDSVTGRLRGLSHVPPTHRHTHVNASLESETEPEDDDMPIPTQPLPVNLPIITKRGFPEEGLLASPQKKVRFTSTNQGEDSVTEPESDDSVTEPESDVEGVIETVGSMSHSTPSQ